MIMVITKYKILHIFCGQSINSESENWIPPRFPTIWYIHVHVYVCMHAYYMQVQGMHACTCIHVCIHVHVYCNL